MLKLLLWLHRQDSQDNIELFHVKILSFPVYTPHFFPTDLSSKRGVSIIYRNINCKTFS